MIDMHHWIDAKGQKSTSWRLWINWKVPRAFFTQVQNLIDVGALLLVHNPELPLCVSSSLVLLSCYCTTYYLYVPLKYNVGKIIARDRPDSRLSISVAQQRPCCVSRCTAQVAVTSRAVTWPPETETRPLHLTSAIISCVTWPRAYNNTIVCQQALRPCQFTYHGQKHMSLVFMSHSKERNCVYRADMTTIYQ